MPDKEVKRSTAIKRFLDLEINKDREFTDLLKMAAIICRTSYARITILDEDTQHISFGVEPESIGFQATYPLTTHDRYTIGSICVLDPKPMSLNEEQVTLLTLLSKQITHLLEFESSLGILKQQYKQVKSSKDKLRSFFDSSSSGHLLIGGDFRILAYNNSISKFIESVKGMKVHRGLSVLDFLLPSFVPDFKKHFQNAMRGLSAQFTKYAVYAERQIWWNVSFEPARDAAGEIIGVSYNTTDITDKVNTEELLSNQAKSLRNIAYIQSHEIRKPVASILGIMEMIKNEDYRANPEELLMMERAVKELDCKIRKIININLEH